MKRLQRKRLGIDVFLLCLITLLALVFCFDFHPLSKTLYEAFFKNSTTAWRASISPQVLWSFVVQISGAIHHIHSNSIAARIIDSTKILITGKNRFRLNCCGVADLLQWNGSNNFLQMQQEDLLSFGHLILSLACGTPMAIHNLKKSVEFISQTYSQDLSKVISYLLMKPSPNKRIDDILPMLAPVMLKELNFAHEYNDNLEGELSKELENGRLVRLMSKLGFINERPEFESDPKWSETGDRYLLTLFRDYVFHQVDEHGAPLIDMGHVIQCLNKVKYV
jgi:PAB-dependent poly(A)-specific ribonuclease subunit 3